MVPTQDTYSCMTCRSHTQADRDLSGASCPHNTNRNVMASPTQHNKNSCMLQAAHTNNLTPHAARVTVLLSVLHASTQRAAAHKERLCIRQSVVADTLAATREEGHQACPAVDAVCVVYPLWSVLSHLQESTITQWQWPSPVEHQQRSQHCQR